MQSILRRFINPIREGAARKVAVRGQPAAAKHTWSDAEAHPDFMGPVSPAHQQMQQVYNEPNPFQGTFAGDIFSGSGYDSGMNTGDTMRWAESQPWAQQSQQYGVPSGPVGGFANPTPGVSGGMGALPQAGQVASQIGQSLGTLGSTFGFGKSVPIDKAFVILKLQLNERDNLHDVG